MSQKRQFQFPGAATADKPDGTQSVQVRNAMAKTVGDPITLTDGQPAVVAVSQNLTIPTGAKLRVDWKAFLGVNFPAGGAGTFYTIPTLTLQVTGQPDAVLQQTVQMAASDPGEEIEQAITSWEEYDGLSGPVTVTVMAQTSGGDGTQVASGRVSLLTTVVGGS